MPTAYFDTTVYDDIAKSKVTPGDRQAVRRLIARGAIRAYPSVVNVEELLGQWESDPSAALQRIEILVDLVGVDNVLKQPRDLLDEAIHAYAEGRTAAPVTMRRADRDLYFEHLNGLLQGHPDFDVSGVLADIRKMKDDFKQRMAEARERVLTELQWASHPIEELTFDAFFNDGAPQWAEDFADHLGVVVGNACRTRGLAGLIDVRTVRICIGAHMSLVHAQVVGDGEQSRHPRRGDGYDLWHAVSGSVADIFVTSDGPLRQQLQRLPVADFKVVKSLRELLDDPRVARLR